MRWQKIARLAILVFVVGFAIVVFLAMRRRPTAPAGSEDIVRSDPGAILESGAGEHKAFNFGKLDFNLKYDKALTYKDGRSKFVGVTLTLPDRDGRTFVVTANEGEARLAAGEARRPHGREAHGQRQAHDRQRARGRLGGRELRRQAGHPDHPWSGHVHPGADEGLRGWRHL